MIAKNLNNINLQIEQACKSANRDVRSVKLMAVSKLKPLSDIQEAVGAGQMFFGENRVQEGVEKIKELNNEKVRVDLIGPLQRNKAKHAVGLFHTIHSVDRIELAETISQRARHLGITQNVLMQVNISEEESKSGVSPDAASYLLEKLLALSDLQVDGLMCIGSFIPSTAPEVERKREFIKMRNLRQELQNEHAVLLPELSMGMSHDFELAIAHGATIVRVGSAIFGERSYTEN